MSEILWRSTIYCNDPILSNPQDLDADYWAAIFFGTVNSGTPLTLHCRLPALPCAGVHCLLFKQLTRWLSCVECPQYSIRFEARAVTWIIVCRRLGMSPFWAYSDVIRPRPLRPSTLWHGVSCHSWTGVGRRIEFGGFFCTERTDQGNDFDFIPTVARRVAVYLWTHCNTGSKWAFPTGVLVYLFTDAQDV